MSTDELSAAGSAGFLNSTHTKHTYINSQHELQQTTQPENNLRNDIMGRNVTDSDHNIGIIRQPQREGGGLRSS